MATSGSTNSHVAAGRTRGLSRMLIIGWRRDNEHMRRSTDGGDRRYNCKCLHATIARADVDKSSGGEIIRRRHLSVAAGSATRGDAATDGRRDNWPSVVGRDNDCCSRDRLGTCESAVCVRIEYESNRE